METVFHHGLSFQFQPVYFVGRTWTQQYCLQQVRQHMKTPNSAYEHQMDMVPH